MPVRNVASILLCDGLIHKMQVKDDPIIAGIRETRHKISEQFGHDPQKIVTYYIELQKKEEQRRQPKQPKEEHLLEPARAA